MSSPQELHYSSDPEDYTFQRDKGESNNTLKRLPSFPIVATDNKNFSKYLHQLIEDIDEIREENQKRSQSRKRKRNNPEENLEEFYRLSANITPRRRVVNVRTRSRAHRYTNLKDLLQSGVLEVGEKINLKGEEAFIMREGWIQYRGDRYPGAWSFVNAIANKKRKLAEGGDTSSVPYVPLSESLNTQVEEQLGWDEMLVENTGKTIVDVQQIYEQQRFISLQIAKKKAEILKKKRAEQRRKDQLKFFGKTESQFTEDQSVSEEHKASKYVNNNNNNIIDDSDYHQKKNEEDDSECPDFTIEAKSIQWLSGTSSPKKKLTRRTIINNNETLDNEFQSNNESLSNPNFLKSLVEEDDENDQDFVPEEFIKEQKKLKAKEKRLLLKAIELDEKNKNYEDWTPKKSLPSPPKPGKKASSPTSNIIQFEKVKKNINNNESMLSIGQSFNSDGLSMLDSLKPLNDDDEDDEEITVKKEKPQIEEVELSGNKKMKIVQTPPSRTPPNTIISYQEEAIQSSSKQLSSSPPKSAQPQEDEMDVEPEVSSPKSKTPSASPPSSKPSPSPKSSSPSPKPSSSPKFSSQSKATPSSKSPSQPKDSSPSPSPKPSSSPKSSSQSKDASPSSPSPSPSPSSLPSSKSSKQSSPPSSPPSSSSSESDNSQKEKSSGSSKSSTPSQRSSQSSLKPSPKPLSPLSPPSLSPKIIGGSASSSSPSLSPPTVFSPLGPSSKVPLTSHTQISSSPINTHNNNNNKEDEGWISSNKKKTLYPESLSPSPPPYQEFISSEPSISLPLQSMELPSIDAGASLQQEIEIESIQSEPHSSEFINDLLENFTQSEVQSNANPTMLEADQEAMMVEEELSEKSAESPHISLSPPSLPSTHTPSSPAKSSPFAAPFATPRLPSSPVKTPPVEPTSTPPDPSDLALSLSSQWKLRKSPQSNPSSSSSSSPSSPSPPPSQPSPSSLRSQYKPTLTPEPIPSPSPPSSSPQPTSSPPVVEQIPASNEPHHPQGLLAAQWKIKKEQSKAAKSSASPPAPSTPPSIVISSSAPPAIRSEKSSENVQPNSDASLHLPSQAAKERSQEGKFSVMRFSPPSPSPPSSSSSSTMQLKHQKRIQLKELDYQLTQLSASLSQEEVVDDAKAIEEPSRVDNHQLQQHILLPSPSKPSVPEEVHTNNDMIHDDDGDDVMEEDSDVDLLSVSNSIQEDILLDDNDEVHALYRGEPSPVQSEKPKPALNNNNDNINNQVNNVNKPTVNSKRENNNIVINKERRSIKRDEPTEGPVILASGLNSKMLKRIQTLVHFLGGKITVNFRPDVTHLVTLTYPSPSRPKCKLVQRTMKYCKSVLKGIWILSYDWIIDSFHSQRWVNEEKYEVIGDLSSSTSSSNSSIVQTSISAPKRSRLIHRKNKDNSGLFADMKFVLCGNFDRPTKNEVRDLIIAGGGKLFLSLPHPPRSSVDEQKIPENDRVGEDGLPFVRNDQSTILLCDPKFCDFDSVKKLYFDSGLSPLRCEYLFDCISHYKVLPSDVYQMLKFEDDDEFHTQMSLAF